MNGKKIKSLLYNSNSSEIKETQVTVLFFFFFNKRIRKSRPLDFLIFLVGKSIFPRDIIPIKDSKKVLLVSAGRLNIVKQESVCTKDNFKLFTEIILVLVVFCGIIF